MDIRLILWITNYALFCYVLVYVLREKVFVRVYVSLKQRNKNRHAIQQKIQDTFVATVFISVKTCIKHDNDRRICT